MPFIRLIFAVTIALFLATSAAYGQSKFYDLLEDFDARPLTKQEKRVLQMALALKGHYSGLLDGVWGSGSQSAFERYTSAAFAQEPINLHTTVLLADYAQQLETDGWQMRRFPDAGISVALPMKALKLEELKPTVKSWEHNTKDLSVLITLNDNTLSTQKFHKEAESYNIVLDDPYIVRKDSTWITSVSNGSKTLYLRSERFDWNWTSILLIAGLNAKNEINAVSASVSRNAAYDLSIPQGGRLSHLINLTLEYLEQQTEPDSSNVPNTANPPSKTNTASTGTGFFVNRNGVILTNNHVVERCVGLKVGNEEYRTIAQSEEFDLAALSSVSDITVDTYAKFDARPAKLNSDVTVAGFPLHGLLSGLNVTRGSITSLLGLSGDLTKFQISAAVQPGNSGGPVLDMNGNVAGVVVGKLDALQVAEATGDIPQNINFAIKGDIAKSFLASNSIDFDISDNYDRIDPIEIADIAMKISVLVKCEPN